MRAAVLLAVVVVSLILGAERARPMALADALPPIPPTPKKPVTDVYRGVSVVDYYRWLEDWNDPAVQAWSDAQSARTRAYLDGLPGRASTRDRLKALYANSGARYYVGWYRGGVLSALKRQHPKQQPFLIALDSPDHPETARVVVDPNQLDPKGLTAIDWYVPSRDGRLVAVSLSEGGTESGTLHIYEVATGKPLPGRDPAGQQRQGGWQRRLDRG